MLILALESSAKAASVCLAREGELLAVSSQRTGLTHSATLLPMVRDLLRNAGVEGETIDAVAVAHGPGSFTGVRIGVSTAKGLCWGWDKPAIGVSTLEALAYLSEGVGEDRLICSAMDARRGQLYSAFFRWEDGALLRLTPDRALSAEEMAAEAAALGQSVWVLGDGAELAERALTGQGVPCRLAPEHLRWQNAWGVARAAMGATPRGAEELLPVYLRLSQAERERQAKENLNKDKR